MSGVNKVIVLGNVGNDPQTFTDEKGNLISAKVSVATNQKWKDKNGNDAEHIEWHRITFFKRLAEIVNQYIKKGSKIYIEGMLRTNKWTDKNGQDRYTTEIIASNLQMIGEANTKKVQQENKNNPEECFNDEIPF